MAQQKTKQQYISQIKTALMLYEKQIEQADKKYPDQFILVVSSIYTKYSRRAGLIYRVDGVSDPMAASKIRKAEAELLVADAERNGRPAKMLSVRQAFVEYRDALEQMLKMLQGKMQ